MKKTKLIKISEEFKKTLDKLGKKGDTYEDIIKRNFKQQPIVK